MRRPTCRSDGPGVSRRLGLPLWTAVLLLAALAGAGCQAPPATPNGNENENNNDNVTPPNARAADCLGCHTDEALLKEVAREEPPPPADTGEG
jgi:hypothetical protein